MYSINGSSIILNAQVGCLDEQRVRVRHMASLPVACQGLGVWLGSELILSLQTDAQRSTEIPGDNIWPGTE